MVSSDCYAILGVRATATEDEIRKAYRKKALQYHPDKNSSSTAEEIFKEINKAYETLSDVDKRRTYDLQYQTTNMKYTSTSQPQRKYESTFPSSASNHANSARFRFHDPFFTLRQRHAFFSSKLHQPEFSFYDSYFGSSDDEENDSDHFDPVLSSFHTSHRRFHGKTRPSWSHSSPFESDPFSMFEMLTRSIFDKFLKDDFFWNRSSARLNSSTQAQRGQPTTKTTTTTNRTNIPVNHVDPKTNYRYEMKRTSSNLNSTNSDDEEEEEIEEHFVYQQPKPSTMTNDQYSRPHSTTYKSKSEICQYCFYPIGSGENIQKHEAICRHRPEQEKIYTTKCSYCHENIRLSEYLDHEERCKQSRQSTETKRYYNPLSKSVHNENLTNSKFSSGNTIT